MGNTKLLTKLLCLKDVKITWFNFENYNKELHLGLKPYKTGCCCSTCGRRCPIVRTMESRSWTDVTILGRKIVLWFAPRVVDCPTHGRVQEAIPWAAPYARVTYRLEYLVCSFSKVMPQKAAALRATCKIIQPLNARAGRVWGFCRILAVNRFFLVVRADIRGFWTRKSIALIK